MRCRRCSFPCTRRERRAACSAASCPGRPRSGRSRFRAALAERGITACILSKKNRKQPIPYDKALYRQRHRIETMFGRLKDWRRIATRDDRCATIFLGAISLAAIVIFSLGE
jgi:transposase